MDKSYGTVMTEAEADFVEKRSRFIGRCRPVTTEEEAQAFIAAVRKNHWDAAHNVWAYVLRGGVMRYSDDGEPQGTAGQPALNVLLKRELTDCAVVITRYFGGILLGAGGLTRAYTQGAVIAVEAAGEVDMRPCLRGDIDCSYAQYGMVARLVAACGGVVEDAAYGEAVRVRFHLPAEGREALQQALTEKSCGSLSIKEVEKIHLPFPRK